MKTMFILISHEMTEQQYRDAKDSLGVDRFKNITLPIWSQIPADAESVEAYLGEIKESISTHRKRGDLLLIQGDFGATFNMVQFAKEIGVVPIYATTRRKATESVDGDRVTTSRTFEHVRFRKY